MWSSNHFSISSCFPCFSLILIRNWTQFLQGPGFSGSRFLRVRVQGPGFRSSHTLIGQRQPREVFCIKVILRNFAKFTGKHLCQSLFFNKVAGFFYTPWRFFDVFRGYRKGLQLYLKRDSGAGVFL